MGETRNIIMVHVRSTLLFAAILVFVSGLPHGADEYQQASTEINMLLQQGKDQSACADLAKTLVDEVTASVKLSNKLLADLDDGSSCPSEGQEAVKAAQRNKDAADKAAREAATAASKASGAEIDFGAYSLSSLTEDKCGQFWENKAYKSAKAAAAAADSAKTTADAKAKAAAGVLDDETKAAAEAVKACQCQVRKSYGACTLSPRVALQHFLSPRVALQLLTLIAWQIRPGQQPIKTTKLIKQVTPRVSTWSAFWRGELQPTVMLGMPPSLTQSPLRMVCPRSHARKQALI